MRDQMMMYTALLVVCIIFWYAFFKALGLDPFSPSIFVDLFELAFFGGQP